MSAIILVATFATVSGIPLIEPLKSTQSMIGPLVSALYKILSDIFICSVEKLSKHVSLFSTNFISNKICVSQSVSPSSLGKRLSISLPSFMPSISSFWLRLILVFSNLSASLNLSFLPSILPILSQISFSFASFFMCFRYFLKCSSHQLKLLPALRPQLRYSASLWSKPNSFKKSCISFIFFRFFLMSAYIFFL